MRLGNLRGGRLSVISSLVQFHFFHYGFNNRFQHLYGCLGSNDVRHMKLDYYFFKIQLQKTATVIEHLEQQFSIDYLFFFCLFHCMLQQEQDLLIFIYFVNF